MVYFIPFNTQCCNSPPQPALINTHAVWWCAIRGRCLSAQVIRFLTILIMLSNSLTISKFIIRTQAERGLWCAGRAAIIWGACLFLNAINLIDDRHYTVYMGANRNDQMRCPLYSYIGTCVGLPLRCCTSHSFITILVELLTHLTTLTRGILVYF